MTQRIAGIPLPGPFCGYLFDVRETLKIPTWNRVHLGKMWKALCAWGSHL